MFKIQMFFIDQHKNSRFFVKSVSRNYTTGNADDNGVFLSLYKNFSFIKTRKSKDTKSTKP